MSSVNLADKDGQTYRPDVFERTEGAETVVIQAVTHVDPATGLPNASTEATLQALKAVADNLLLASQAIETATEALNTKAVALNTGAIAGTVSISNFPAGVDVVSVDNFPATQTIAGQVALDSATLSALENINANTGGLTDAQLRASAIPVAVDAEASGMATDVKLDEVINKLPELTAENKVPVESLVVEAMLESLQIFMLAVLEKMPRLDGNDRLLVSHAESNPTVGLSANQTLAILTTLANQTNIGGRDASHIAYAMANAGALHIYDKIQVS